MKIILLKDVKKQGKARDIINVKDGYGTFLINNGSAIIATENSISKLEKENKKMEIIENETIKACEKLKKELENTNISFKVKTGENDKVFGSITPKQIAEQLKDKGYDIDKKQIKIDETISSLGFHNVQIELHKKVIANIKVELRK